MANVIEHENRLETEMKALHAVKMKNFKVGMSITGIAFVLCIFLTFIFPGFVIFNGIWVVSLFYSLFQLLTLNGNGITKSGLDGENRTKWILQRLSDEYTVVQDITVVAEGGQSQLDNVVVGPTGVFVIETKNHNGRIEGNDSDKDFYQHKVGRGGTPYGKHFHSPIKQVGTHVFRLSRFLREQGLDTWVQGAVFFSNPSADVRVRSEKTPVFTCREGPERMLQFITAGNGKHISRSRQEAIVKALQTILADAQ